MSGNPTQAPGGATALPTVLVIAYGDLARDPRVSRQISWLAGRYRVIAAGNAAPSGAGVEFVDLSRKLTGYEKLRRFVGRLPGARPAYLKLKASVFWKPLKSAVDAVRGGGSAPPAPGGAPGAAAPADTSGERHIAYYRRNLAQRTDFAALARLQPDLIIANDLDGLILAHLIHPSVRTILDAHEFAPLEYEEGELWINFEQPARVFYCQKLLPGLSGISTVCQAIATKYEQEFALPAKVEVVTNAPFRLDIEPRKTGETMHIVHHGIGTPIRKIELMAEAVKLLDERFELHLILVEGVKDYIDELKSRYRKEPRIHFHDPVPMQEISRFISRFDIGLFILEPAIFNYRFALPNKFFEFIQGRLAIAIGPSPEMQSIVEERELGVVADDFTPEAMARSLRRLTPADVDRYKANVDRAAQEYCAEANRDRMLAMVEKALAAPAGRQQTGGA